MAAPRIGKVKTPRGGSAYASSLVSRDRHSPSWSLTFGRSWDRGGIAFTFGNRHRDQRGSLAFGLYGRDRHGYRGYHGAHFRLGRGYGHGYDYGHVPSYGYGRHIGLGYGRYIDLGYGAYADYGYGRYASYGLASHWYPSYSSYPIYSYYPHPRTHVYQTYNTYDYGDSRPTRINDADLYYDEAYAAGDNANVGTTWYEPDRTETIALPSEAVVRAPASPGDYFLDEGLAAFRRGEYAVARDAFVRAVFTDEQNGYAKVLYGYANFATGDHAMASMAIRRALITTPELIDQPVDIYDLYRANDRLESHMVRLANHVDAHPADHEALFVLAYVHLAAGDVATAALEFGGLLEQFPTDDAARVLREVARTAAGG